MRRHKKHGHTCARQPQDGAMLVRVRPLLARKRPYAREEDEPVPPVLDLDAVYLIVD